MNDSEQWYVLGAGAIGTLIALGLQRVGYRGTLLQHHPQHARRTVIDDGETRKLEVKPFATVAAGSIRRLLLTTKAGQLAAALTQALPFLSDDAVVLSTANGLGFETQLNTVLRGRVLHRAVSTSAAFRDGNGVVHIAANGTTRVGSPGRTINAPGWFVDSLQHLPGWSWDASIEAALGEKFAINCMINGLTASLSCRNGELLEAGGAGTALRSLCLESEPALRALGLWRRQESLLDVASDVCRSTAANRSSMLQDVLAGRATEMQYLNAELLRRAAAIGLDLPLNRHLVEQLL